MINKDKEVGGTHYADMKIEPFELIDALDLDFVQGNIIKYVSRYKNKGGNQDLEKAIHYCDMIINKFLGGNGLTYKLSKQQKFVIKMYCEINGLTDIENLIIGHAIAHEYKECKSEINKLIDR